MEDIVFPPPTITPAADRGGGIRCAHDHMLRLQPIVSFLGAHTVLLALGCQGAHDRTLGVYYAGWGRMPVDSLPAEKMSHVYYAFAVVDEDGRAVLKDREKALDSAGAPGRLAQLQALNKRNPEGKRFKPRFLEPLDQRFAPSIWIGPWCQHMSVWASVVSRESGLGVQSPPVARSRTPSTPAT